MKIIARIHNDFPTKFGIPHQSNRLSALKATIVFEPEYRVTEAFRGLEDYDYIWLIWQFSEAVRENWSPTVRPPRLGGNTRMGVFATRSPFRPNSLGLSSVRLEEIEYHSDLGTVLHISGADLMDGTPIYDIKPYLPYVDSHPEAKGGFTDHIEEHILKVEFPEELLQKIPESQREALIEVLANDPRPRYQKNPERVYGIAYGENDVHFKVREESVRAKYGEDNGSVWTDSCVEFFSVPASDGIYYNIECNCIGTILIGAGPARNGREHAPKEVTALVQRWSSLGNEPFEERVDDTTWEVALIIPYAAFFKHQIQSLDGKEVKANFYKCGDELQTPHFLSWNPIKIEKPDFHRPDFFGTLEFE